MSLEPVTRETLFASHRTVSHFTDQQVTDDTLREIYDLTKMGPTAFNSQPLRITWVRSAEARERLIEFMAEGNKEKTRKAPVTAILSFDRSWFERFGEFAPALAQMEGMFAVDQVMADNTGALSAHLQAGYFITAVRALGLAAGPMTGADFAGITEAFVADKNQQAFMVVNLGYGIAPEYPRGLRFDFEDTTETI